MQQIFYKSGRTAWNGAVVFHDNGLTAWNGSIAYFENGRTAWNGAVAFHDNGQTAWNGSIAYFENGRTAWNGAIAFHDNGQTAWNGAAAYYDNGRMLAPNLTAPIPGTNLNNAEVSELEISPSIKLLTKTLSGNIYAVGIKIQLSEKNAILIDKENKLTTNIIQLDQDVQAQVLNNKAKVSVLGQNIFSQK
jgi:hypothetical protein